MLLLALQSIYYFNGKCVALVVAVRRTCIMLSGRKKDPDQKLEIAWLLALVGVFNVTLSIRASGSGAKF